jgi:hypothetical protein
MNPQACLTATGESAVRERASEISAVFVSRPRASRGVIMPGVVTRIKNPKIEETKILPQQRPPPPMRKQAADMARVASDTLN